MRPYSMTMVDGLQMLGDVTRPPRKELYRRFLRQQGRAVHAVIADTRSGAHAWAKCARAQWAAGGDVSAMCAARAGSERAHLRKATPAARASKCCKMGKMAVCHLCAAVAVVAAAACFACSEFEVEPRGRCVELIESFQALCGRPPESNGRPYSTRPSPAGPGKHTRVNPRRHIKRDFRRAG